VLPTSEKQSVDYVAPPTVATGDGDNGSAVATLWKSRMAGDATDESPPSFTLGPGDLLRVSVPLIGQLKDRTVRVSEDGTIALPLVGVISVTGLTEQDLRDVLIHRVSKYMYHPEVEVFLQHTENRQVAVLGSVKNPGRYMLASRTDSIMTMISRAGGLNDDASTRIMLFPAPKGTDQRVQSAAEQAEAQTATLPFTLLAKNDATMTSLADVSEGSLSRSVAPGGNTAEPSSDRFVIDLSRPDNQRYLEMSARPGDVIVVPAAGEVTVQGWVDKPGAFKITPGLTVLGSVAAAGGPNFTSSVTLLREESDGSKLSLPLNLSKIKSGQEADLRVRGGDVIIVEKSVAGAVPYSIYFLLSKLYLGVPY
jgi:polysaccharide export outer membrane protein